MCSVRVSLLRIDPSFRSLILAFVLATLSGCASMGDLGISNLVDMMSSKEEVEVDEEEIAALKAAPEIPQLWHYSMSESKVAVFSPVYENGAIYVADTKGVLARLNPDTGKEIWQIKTRHRFSGGVGAGQGMLLVGTFKGEVLAFDERGDELWKVRVTSEVLSPPQADNDVVVVRSGDGRIFGLDAADGTRKWIYQGPTPALTIRNYASVLITRGAVFAGLAGGKLVAMNLFNGNVGWESTVAQPRGVTELERMTDIVGLPVIDDQQVCAVAYNGRIGCFDMMDGSQIWARDASSNAGLTMDGNNVYVSEDRGAVVAYDKRSGAMMWKQAKLGSRKLSAPLLVRGGLLAVGDADGNVTLLRRHDGSVIARAATDGSAILSSPGYLPDGFVVQTSKGGVYAFAVQ
ncbi:Beta-barrel assembly machine subunit BamB [Nitrosomonas nitrosa]|uniref:Outer membrane protein assembly factor BamB n=1 Tax=Nitrosomonas nitrosa TaxID=52442 RepID=A0A1I4N1L4_9PROT|nr:outer membrane protein assembly factor BamB [Nitrosomonas nitrosa]PTQ96197.1 Beta-barrel assembly machine subunit BamB [Nitrosomonas nitrosa]CAE6489775.1 Outer membrane protein assembly factor BamB [Nitrosomonas nitrosa]SFM09421.1 Beta-barrel assembly machine subunit BamB [Nitrosomonas nitrosa]